MKKLRSIEEIFRNDKSHWVGNGFKVNQYFPLGRGMSFMERFSPFIMLDYNAPYLFKGVANSKLGVGAHPHRGFETVTIALDGYVEHGDNKGNSGVIGPGDVQWMTAGSGILHKEFHEIEYAKEDHMFHMVQLWVNLPAKYKMTEPKYQSITKEQMKNIKIDSGEITLIAGEVLGENGPASTFSKMNVYIIELNTGAKISITEPSYFNLGMLILQGDATINEKKISSGDFVLFKNEEGDLEFTGGDEKAKILVLSGEPLNEPVFAQGPFVMNTKEEIIQAVEDFNNGKFGSFDF